MILQARRRVPLALLMAAALMPSCGGPNPHGPDDPPTASPATAPRIAVAGSSVAFTIPSGGENPAAQTFSITNVGGGTLSGLSVTVTYAGPPTNWLEATLSSTQAPATLTLRATTSGLGKTTYSATVSVASSVADNSPQSLYVSCGSGSGSGSQPSIALSPTSITFGATQGGGNPPSQSVSITNGGGGTLSGLSTRITYSGQSNGWLDASLAGTTASTTLTLRATTAGLTSGTHRATVQVQSTAATNSPQSVSADFTVASSTSSAPDLQSVTVSGSQVTLRWTFSWPALIGSNDQYQLEKSTNSSSGFALVKAYECTEPECRQNVYVATLTESPGTYYYRVRARTPIASTGYSQVKSAIVSSSGPRQITIRNQIASGLKLTEVVQMKFAGSQSGVYTRDDLLTPDPAWCVALPGESIPRGGSRTFAIPGGASTYWVFLGMGLWETNFQDCSSSSRAWIKNRRVMTTTFDLLYIWTVVQVTGQSPDNWTWTISGSYMNANLVVTPQGDGPISFKATRNDPIP